LQRWHADRQSPPMKIWYYGTDPRVLRDPDVVWLHNHDLRSPDDLYRLVDGHYLAVGKSMLGMNPKATPAAEIALMVLKAKEPVARTSTFFIYDFTDKRSVVSAP
jgi:hypothetical protein